MSVETIAIFAAGLLVGILVGLAISVLLRSGRSQVGSLEAAGRLSAAEASARLEAERRQELDRELDHLRGELARLDRDAAVAEERAEQADALIAELKDFRERSRKELEDNFKALAAEALAGSNKQFLHLAEQRLATSEERSKADLEERKQAVENLLQPLHKTLQSLDQKSQDMEKARVDAYSRIDEQVRLLAQATNNLQRP